MTLRVTMLMGLLLSLRLAADDGSAQPPRWPQFRGPDSLGIASPAMKLPADIGPGKHVVWKVPVPGGHSSPCVWDDRIYITGCDKPAKLLETLCLRRSDGSVIWRAGLTVKTWEDVHQLNSLATATPVTDGDHIYVCFGSFGLACYSKDGNQRWQKPMAPIPSRFGSGASLALAGEHVLVPTGSQSALSLVAVDRKTGEEVWQKDRPRGFSTGLWSTPVVLQGSQGLEVLVVGGARAVVYRLGDGAQRWTFEGLPPISLNTPAVQDGLAVFSLTNPIGSSENVVALPSFDEALKLYDRNRQGRVRIDEVPREKTIFTRGREDKVGDWAPLSQAMRGYDADKDGALDKDEWNRMADQLRKTAENARVGVYCLRLESAAKTEKAEPVWTQTRAVPEVPSPLIYRGRVYLVSEKGILTCRDLITGTEHFQVRLPLRGTCYASPVACDGKIYICSDGGTLLTIQEGSTYQMIGKTEFGEAILATPALVDGKMYLRTEKHLWALGN